MIVVRRPPRSPARRSCRRRDLWARVVSRQVVEDRAVRPAIAVAVLHELMERASHRLQLLDLLIELADVVLRHAADVGARAAPVAPEAEELLDLLHREAEVAGPANEAQRVDVVGVVDPVAAVGAPGPGRRARSIRSAESSSPTRRTPAPPARCSCIQH